MGSGGQALCRNSAGGAATQYPTRKFGKDIGAKADEVSAGEVQETAQVFETWTVRPAYKSMQSFGAPGSGNGTFNTLALPCRRIKTPT